MSAPAQVRERTTRWSDPVAALEAAAGMTGMEVLQAIAAGTLPPPPLAETLGFGLGEVAEGRASFVLDPAEYHYNPLGMVHGGVISALLDTAMGCAVHSTLPAGVGYGTTDLQVRFVRAVTTATGRIRADGTVVHRGGRLATAEGRLVAEATGKLLATATTACLLTG